LVDGVACDRESVIAAIAASAVDGLKTIINSAKKDAAKALELLGAEETDSVQRHSWTPSTG
jgi:hypothetical protein